MLPTTVSIKGIQYERRMSVGQEVVYMNPESVFSISLREDPQGRIEEKLDCLIRLITVSTGWVSFENNLIRNQFLKVINTYYSQYPSDFNN